MRETTRVLIRKNVPMRTRHFLIADDVDTEKIGQMRGVIERNPYNEVHIARSAREALRIIGVFGKDLAGGAIDYDFIGEAETGADIISALRNTNASAAIACVTARGEGAFEEAKQRTFAAGADAVFTSQRCFEGDLGAVLAA